MNRTVPILLLVCGAVFLLGSCANPINSYTAQNYYAMGVQAENAGDLALAGRDFSRAYGNAKMGNLGPAAEASYLYEYARVTGYARNYDESEKDFVEVLALIDKAKREADRLRAPTLAEYSRLLHDTGQHQKAVPIYERAVAELEKLGIESSDPIGFASLLDDYAESLKSAGLANRASAVAARVATLRAAHANEAPHFQPRRYKV